MTVTFYLDAKEEGKADIRTFNQNTVDVVFEVTKDSFNHAFGSESVYTPYIKSVELNGKEVDGAEKKVILNLLGGGEMVLSTFRNVVLDREFSND